MQRDTSNLIFYIRPIIVNYSFILTCPHREKTSSKCCMKVEYLITNGEKKFFFQILEKTQVPGIQNKTNNIKIDSENKSIFVI